MGFTAGRGLRAPRLSLAPFLQAAQVRLLEPKTLLEAENRKHEHLLTACSHSRSALAPSASCSGSCLAREGTRPRQQRSFLHGQHRRCARCRRWRRRAVVAGAAAVVCDPDQLDIAGVAYAQQAVVAGRRPGVHRIRAGTGPELCRHPPPAPVEGGEAVMKQTQTTNG